MMRNKVEYKVNNIHVSPELTCVTLDGEIGMRYDKFIYERITSKFALDYIWKEAEEVFADKYDDEYAAGMWRSEFWGKLILSAVRVCRMSGDSSLKEEIRQSAYRMLSYQTDEGVISTYRDGDNIMPPNSMDAVKDMGWECTYNWNIWGQKYTLWAMLECAQLLDDQCILNCCARMADHIIEQLDRLGVRLKDTGTALMVGMPPCSILKPMLVLYRLTGKESYLSFCLDIAKDWMREDNEMPNLINNARSGIAPSKWYDGWYAKAYEMMSCFDGIAELYRVTGDTVYFDAVKGIWELLSKYELNILGSVGYCERFFDGASQFDSATEVCDAIHWMRICHELFMLSGEAKYRKHSNAHSSTHSLQASTKTARTAHSLYAVQAVTGPLNRRSRPSISTAVSTMRHVRLLMRQNRSLQSAAVNTTSTAISRPVSSSAIHRSA